MSTNNQIPSEIEAIIEKKVAELTEVKRQKEEAEKLARQQAEAEGKAKFDAHIEKTLPMLPEWIRPYYVPGEPDYFRIYKGWDRVEYELLNFSIPGLTKLQYHPKDEVWRCAVAVDPDYYDGEPWLDMGSDWNVDLEYILARARKEVRNLAEYVAKYAKKAEEHKKRREQEALQEQEEEARNRELEARGELEHQKQAREETALFDVLRNDAVAMWLVKAFLFINDERSSFRQQVENADWALYNMEERHSRHAAELRRQADEVERRAEDERSRLQGDLDDAEAKLKKAERGW